MGETVRVEYVIFATDIPLSSVSIGLYVDKQSGYEAEDHYGCNEFVNAELIQVMYPSEKQLLSQHETRFLRVYNLMNSYSVDPAFANAHKVEGWVNFEALAVAPGRYRRCRHRHGYP